jgi:hypothetical protein
MKRICFFLLFIISCLNLKAQVVFWKSYQTDQLFDYGYWGEPLSDGYIFCGQGYRGTRETLMLVRTDLNGDTLWSTKIGGTLALNEGQCVQPVSNGGFIACGKTNCFTNSMDYFAVRTDANGDTLWTRIYGGTSVDDIYTVRENSDGGFLFAGTSQSFGTQRDFFVVRTNANGDTLWTRDYGGSLDDECTYAEQTSDGGFIFSGYTTSFGSGVEDILLIKTDANGDTLWAKIYGGTGSDRCFSSQQTADGGYMLAGTSNSFGMYDAMLIKTDMNGIPQWTKLYGGNNPEMALNVMQNSDGGYVFGGYTYSFGPVGNGVSNGYLVRTNAIGDTLWTRVFGDTPDDAINCVRQCSDGGFICTGYAFTNAQGRNFYALRVDSTGYNECNLYNTNSHVLSVTTIFGSVPVPRHSTSGCFGYSPHPGILAHGVTVVTQCSNVGVQEEIGYSSYTLFPNPFLENVELNFEKPIETDQELNVLNTCGQNVYHLTLKQGTSMVKFGNNLAAGMYFVQMGDGKIAQIVKLPQ